MNNTCLSYKHITTICCPRYLKLQTQHLWLK